MVGDIRSTKSDRITTNITTDITRITNTSNMQIPPITDTPDILDMGDTPDITIRTPAVQAIQSRMEQRFNGTLRPHFDSGALGFGGNGQIVVRDASQLPIRDRVAINAAVADDNRDRQAVYREIAVANGHPEWEAQIRDVFARQWIASARPGWWYQQGGSWQQK